jgi:hypothetical protein
MGDSGKVTKPGMIPKNRLDDMIKLDGCRYISIYRKNARKRSAGS